MMNKILLYIVFLLLPVSLLAQSTRDTVITGTINNRSAENIYINFDNTQGIEKGDTLFIKKKRKLRPAIRVDYVSSKSIAGVSISKYKLKAGDKIYAKIKIVSEANNLPVETGVLVISATDTVTLNPKKKYEHLDTKQPKVSGKITMQSYSNFANYGSSPDYQRWRYAFSLNADNISSSNLSYTHYINFAYRASDWNSISSNLGRAIRVYDLALKYDFSNSTNVWLGRHLNRRISNMGTIDGLQFQTSFSTFSLGLVAGSRPNFSDMGLNSKLFEYGAYLSKFDSLGQRGMYNTLAYFEQTNDFKTDRRFLYFQHSNSIIENIRIFLSTEIDLYKKINGDQKGDFSLTSLYVSANFRPSRAVSFFVSYDARKNVISYETFKDFVDSVFENETRQGFRTRVRFKPVRNLFIGVNYGYRFKKGDLRPSNNYGGYLTYSLIPFIKSGLTLSYTRLYSSYVNGTIWGIRLYKDFATGWGFSLGYRNTGYKFTQNISSLTQRSYSININTRILNPVFVNFTYEGIFESVRTSGRLLINLSYRF